MWRISRGFLKVVETMKKTSRMKRISIIGTIGTSARLRGWRWKCMGRSRGAGA
jgi:hypothetical protein